MRRASFYLKGCSDEIFTWICMGLSLSMLSYADAQFSPPALKLVPLTIFKVELNSPVW